MHDIQRVIHMYEAEELTKEEALEAIIYHAESSLKELSK